MAEQFYSILTKTGKAKVANSSALGTKVNFTTFVLGDGNGAYYNPTEDQTSLKNEVWRGPVNNLKIHKDNNNWIVAVVSIPATIGNFMIREAGILDEEGNLLVIGKYPETYKPIAANGSTKDLTIRMILEVSNTAAVTLKVDPSTTIATKEDVEELQEQIENIKVPLTSVNGKTGDVVLNAEDIGAARQSDLIGVQEKISNLSSNDMEARKEIIDMKLKLKEQTAINFLNKTGIGFYDTFENNNNIDTTTTSTYDSTSKNVDFPFVPYKVKATADYNNVALINVDKQPTIGDKIDNINKILQSVVKDNSVTYDRTVPVSVVNSDLQTSATARPQVLSNGWIVSCAYDSANKYLYFYVDKNDGNGFALLGFLSIEGNFAITSYDNKIYLCFTNDSITFCKIDATTQTGGKIGFSIIKNIDTSQTSFGTGCSIAVNSKGELTAAWCSKNSTYPNSFNIRSAKSIDGGVTWTKQDGTAGVDQITNYNVTSCYAQTPYVQYDKNDNPIILALLYNGSDYNIYSFRYSTIWGQKSIYTVTSHSQSNQVATLQKYGTNAGRIWVAWHGADSTETSHFNIRVSYSDDGGVTWSAMQQLTSGIHRTPSITTDINGNVYIMCSGVITGNYSIRMIIFDNGTQTWGSIINITDVASNHMFYPSTCDNYYNFTNPITVWQDNVNNRVAFYGKWTAQIKTYDITLENPITVAKDQALNIYPPAKILKMKDEKFDTFNNLELNCYVNEINKAPIKGVVNNSTSVVTGVTNRELVTGDKLFTNNDLNEVLSVNDNIVSHNVQDTTVINQPYTSGNGGGKLVRLSDGSLVSAVKQTGGWIIFKSIDGISWVKGHSTSGYSSVQDIALVAKESVFYLLATLSNTVYIFKYDDITGYNTYWNIDTQTVTGNCSLAINPQETELHACWSSKNGTYPNSFNIRYCKGIINSDGSVTWGSVEQVTTNNILGYDIENTCIIINGTNNPVILLKIFNGSSYFIYVYYNNDSTWSYNLVYSGGSYTQASPSAIYVPKEINGLANGRIWVTWHGLDSTDTTANNIHCKYSDDNGVTWNNSNGSTDKLTSGNINPQLNPTITSDNKGNIYVIFNGYDGSAWGIRQLVYTTSWSSIVTIKSGVPTSSVPNSLYDLSINFSSPLFIYTGSSKIGFYGTWISKEGYNLTMKNPVTLTDGQQVPIVDIVAKQGDKDLDLKAIDNEKFVFKGSNLNANITSISVQGKDIKLNSIVYAIS